MADSEQRTAPAETKPPAPQSVGEKLKQARIAHDLSLEQVSTELRIEAQQLAALEQDTFERIGVPVFVKGYLRQYGTRLGLDVTGLLAQYHQQTSLQEIQIQPSKTIKLRNDGQITVWIIAAVILAVVIGALATWYLNGGGFSLSMPAPATETRTEPAPADDAAASGGAASGALAPGASSAETPAAVPTPAEGAPAAPVKQPPPAQAPDSSAE
jgi:cytoskeleton protein RodZ